MKIPFYAKASLLLIGLYVLLSMLYIAQGIILPFIYATIFSVSISPAVNYLVNNKMNRSLAITVVLTISFLIITAIFAMLSSQISLLSDAYPKMVEKFQILSDQTILWFSSCFNVSVSKINTWIASANGELINKSGTAIGLTLTTMGGFLSVAFLIPVYIFMILFYQPHLIEFIHRIFGTRNDIKIGEIMIKIKRIIQSYLAGLFAEFAIVATLNTICLFILGIDYPILFGVLGALLNVIPYIGGIIVVGLFMVIALITKTPIYALYVFIMYATIQFIDNHYIVPKVIGSKVKLNALFCLLAVFAGAALWGIPGMFLSIPLTAIIKLVFDNIESLKHWGFLLGDTTPPMKFTVNFKGFYPKPPYAMPSFKKKNKT